MIIDNMPELMMNASSPVFIKLTREERPDHFNFYSFPSGHISTAFVAAACMRKEDSDASPRYGAAG